MQLRKCNLTLLRQKSRRICVSCRVRERRRAPKGVCIRHSQLDIICTLVQKNIIATRKVQFCNYCRLPGSNSGGKKFGQGQVLDPSAHRNFGASWSEPGRWTGQSQLVDCDLIESTIFNFCGASSHHRSLYLSRYQSNMWSAHRWQQHLNWSLYSHHRTF